MTTIVFTTILIIVPLFIFVAVSLPLMILFVGDVTGWVTGIVAAVLFTLFFMILTPSTEQMVENDYYAMMENRPKCIDSDKVSLGCKKDYIVWQKDSITKQYKYDSVKVMLDNEQREILK
jgi:hypothetical protein